MNDNLIEAELSHAYGCIEEAISSLENAIELIIYDYDLRHAKELIKELETCCPSWVKCP